MNSSNLPLQSALLAALLAFGPVAAETATSGGSPLLSDSRADEPGTIPAAPPSAAGDQATMSPATSERSDWVRPAPQGFVGDQPQQPQGFAGPSDMQRNAAPDPNAYHGLWEIQPNNSVTAPHASDLPPQETER